jgi:hypothetical protein
MVPKHPDGGTQESCRTQSFAWLVRLTQAMFLLTALLGLDGPFVSAHNERQNQTFDVARHVFREGWEGVVVPKASFSLPGYETQRFTAVPQELPVHGLFGWPVALLSGHQRAAVRLVSIAFALFSIQLVYWVLRWWNGPGVGAAGACLWAAAPLVLHLGQVPMPDIVCTCAMLASFWFALQGRSPASSLTFAFALLAKVSVIPFGLPILVALLTAEGCHSKGRYLRRSILWGIFPTLTLACWILSTAALSPASPWTLAEIAGRQNASSHWYSLKLWAMILGCLFPFGLGIIGALGLAFARQAFRRLNPWVLGAVLFSNGFYFLTFVKKITEFQYLLPSLFWLLLIAAFGFRELRARWQQGAAWRAGLGLALAAHLLVTVIFTLDLKASRVPAFADLQAAAGMIPPDARVIVFYRFYGASAAVWLDRNVLAIANLQQFQTGLPRLQALGFNYVLLFDVENRRLLTRVGSPAFRNWFSVLRSAAPPEAVQTRYADPASPARQFCDGNFSRLFEKSNLVLYALPSAPGPDPK